MTLEADKATYEAGGAAPEVLTQAEAIDSLGRYGYGWADSDVAGASAQRGLKRQPGGRA